MLFVVLLSLTCSSAGAAEIATQRPLDAGCDRRADIVAVRAAKGEDLRAWRRKLDAEVASLPAGVARGCAAAAAAEAAILDGDKDNTLAFLDIAAAFLPDVRDDIRPHRALLMIELGKTKEAREELKRMDKRSDWYKRLDTKLRQGLLAQAQKNMPAPSRKESVAMVKELLAQAKPHRALAQAEALRTRFPDEAHALDDELREAMANIYWRLDTPEKALPLLTPRRDAKGKLYVGRAKGAARTFARLERFDEAAAAWADVRDTMSVPAKERAEAAFFAGFMFVEKNDAQAAHDAFDAGAALMKDTAFEEATEWARVLIDLSITHDLDAARERLHTMLYQSAKAPSESTKLRYWLGYAAGEGPERQQEWTKLTKDAPLDYYGLLARASLHMKPIMGARHEQPIPGADDGAARRARLLHAIGFDAEAKTVCRARVGKRTCTLADVGACQAVDDAHFGWRKGGTFFFPELQPHFDDQKLRSDIRFRVSYARPWRGVVNDAANKAGIAPSFVMAIMRAESGFDSDARSAAGAHGLMQLLASTARTTKNALELDVDTDRLYDPHVNITLGASLLGLLTREHGSMLLAAAAYNAGPGPTVSWATRHGHLPPALFVERVSFRETRNYMKKVLAVEALYRDLEGDDVTLALPSSITAANTFTAFPYDE